MRSFILPVFLFCTGFAHAQSYVISTIAGGAALPTPISAASASIGDPPRVAADAAGNIYFGSLHSVFKVDTGGNTTRIAGDGQSGYSGDSGPATAAQLEYPDGIAIDPAGNIYVSDMSANVVRKIAADGTISTYAGLGSAGYNGDNGAAAQAQLSAPMGLAVDSAGNLYIADSGNNAIRKVSKDGTISTVAGAGTLGYSGDGGMATAAMLDRPEGVAVNTLGQLYIADTFNNRVRVVSPGGTIQTAVGTGLSAFSGDDGPAVTAALFLPTDVAIDSGGNLYVADYGNSRIRKVAQGSIQTVVGGTGKAVIFNEAPATTIRLNGPTGIAIDAAGDIFLAEGGIGTGTGLAVGDFRIWKINSVGVISTAAGNGIASYSGDSGPAAAAQLNTPSNLALDTVGNLYIADTANNRIRRVSPGGSIITVAGSGIAGFSGDGGLATNAMLNGPEGLATDVDGNVYIADTKNNRIRKLLPSGIIISIAGDGNASFFGDDGPANAAAIHAPQALYNAGGGYIYIADTGNHRIRELLPTGLITTVAGNGGQGSAGDGGPAISAQLNLPTGVTMDASGNLYIADQGSNRVRMVTSDGTISTVAGADTVVLGDGAPAANAQLSAPSSVAVDSGGTIYISDSGHNRIRVVSGGAISTLAGTGICCYTGDGGPASAAQLNAPWGLALDSSGRLFVADSGNNAVRLIQTAPTGGLPAIAAVANGASNQTGAVAGGEIVVIYGSGLGPAQAVAAAVGPSLPQQLGGVSVLVNGVSASLLYVSATQISAIIPASVTGANVNLTVQYRGLSSAAVTAPLSIASPAIFTANSMGSGQALAINADGSINNASHPAAQGSTLKLYVNGVLSQFLAGVLSVTIEGQPANIINTLSVASSPGVTEVQVQVPFGIPAAAATPVFVQVGGATSPAGVTVAVSII